MRMRTVIGFTVLLVLIGCAPAMATPTVTVFAASDGTRYALTPGENGNCSNVAGGTECTSSTGAAAAYDSTGCGAVSGTGMCIVIPSGWTWDPTTVVNATSTLECDGDKKYELTTGNDDGTCTPNNGQNMECTDTNNVAKADCTDGCGEVQGGGKCTVK